MNKKSNVVLLFIFFTYFSIVASTLFPVVVTCDTSENCSRSGYTIMYVSESVQTVVLSIFIANSEKEQKKNPH